VALCQESADLFLGTILANPPEIHFYFAKDVVFFLSELFLDGLVIIEENFLGIFTLFTNKEVVLFLCISGERASNKFPLKPVDEMELFELVQDSIDGCGIYIVFSLVHFFVGMRRKRSVQMCSSERNYPKRKDNAKTFLGFF